MTLSEKLSEIVSSIVNYSYTPNTVYLYPLYERLKLLRKYFSYNSNDEAFDDYIKKVLLPGIDIYIEICENENRVRLEQEDIKAIKAGVLHWESLFKVACKYYSVNILEKQAD